MSTPATSPLESTTSNCMSVEGTPRPTVLMRTYLAAGESLVYLKTPQVLTLLNLLT